MNQDDLVRHLDDLMGHSPKILTTQFIANDGDSRGSCIGVELPDGSQWFVMVEPA